MHDSAVAELLSVHLKPGRERPILDGHPWIFSGAIARWNGPRDKPGIADVFSSEGEWLARGLAHPGCGLAVRILTRRQDEPIDENLIADRLDKALEWRERLFGPIGLDGDTDAYRLVFSESDGLSGLIVDRYNEALAIRLSALAWLPWMDFICEHLRARTGINRVLVSAENDAVELEGLEPAVVAAFSRNAPDRVRIRESGFLYDVDLAHGQKTGFYLDQRESRLRVARYAAGADVLSAYCYTGSFELHAAKAGARSIVGIDSSASALALARAHHQLNGLQVPTTYLEADVPSALRKFRDRACSFDLIILDPPRFVNSFAQLDKGLRAYKDINLLALKLLRAGGILATFSCSGWVKAAELREVLWWAAADARREVQIIETLGQPADHPVLLSFTESDYLHGFLARVV